MGLPQGFAVFFCRSWAQKIGMWLCLRAEYFFASLQQYYLIDKIQNRNSVKQKFFVLCAEVDKKIVKEESYLFFQPLSKAVLWENAHPFTWFSLLLMRIHT